MVFYDDMSSSSCGGKVYDSLIMAKADHSVVKLTTRPMQSVDEAQALQHLHLPQAYTLTEWLALRRRWSINV